MPPQTVRKLFLAACHSPLWMYLEHFYQAYFASAPHFCHYIGSILGCGFRCRWFSDSLPYHPIRPHKPPGFPGIMPIPSSHGQFPVSPFLQPPELLPEAVHVFLRHEERVLRLPDFIFYIPGMYHCPGTFRRGQRKVQRVVAHHPYGCKCTLTAPLPSRISLSSLQIFSKV